MINEPFVSIVTPVYNGEEYLKECIESVLALDYENWEYIIVNNCSTDKTLEIATQYSKKEKRIQVYLNKTFVDAETNHNIAFSLISSESKYCKVVCADDKIRKNCLKEMVRLGENHANVGIINGYQLAGNKIKWTGLPKEITVISGKEVCRISFLKNIHIFGCSSSSLIRSELIRQSFPFYPHKLAHADSSACYKNLINCDLGFVHTILTEERIHDNQLSSNLIKMNAGHISLIDDLIKYGRQYLTEEEYINRKNELIEAYLRFLGGSLLKLRKKKFWVYHKTRLRQIGYPLKWSKIIKKAIQEIIIEIKNPKIALLKFINSLGSRN